MFKKNQESYEQLYVRFSAKMEAIIIKALIGLGMLLVVFQLFLQIQMVREWAVPVESMEGERFELYVRDEFQ